MKLTGILTLSVLLAVKISFEGFGKVNDSIIFFVALYNRLGFLFSKKSFKSLKSGDVISNEVLSNLEIKNIIMYQVGALKSFLDEQEMKTKKLRKDLWNKYKSYKKVEFKNG